eukprot:4175941-Amphidinium_carterae.1
MGSNTGVKGPSIHVKWQVKASNTHTCDQVPLSSANMCHFKMLQNHSHDGISSRAVTVMIPYLLLQNFQIAMLTQL